MPELNEVLQRRQQGFIEPSNSSRNFVKESIDVF